MENAVEFWKRGVGGGDRPMFGQVREDATVECNLAQRTKGRKFLCITSGGCTAFALARIALESVIACDVNASQTRLARLKQRVLLGTRGVERTACLLGAGTAAARLASRFGGEPEGYRKGLQRCGTVDAKLAKLRTLFHGLLVTKNKVEAFLQLNDPLEQASEFERDWRGWRWRTSLRILFHARLFGVFFPTGTFPIPARLDQWMDQRLERLATAFPARCNPFAWEFFAGHLPEAAREGIPILDELYDWNTCVQPEFVTAPIDEIMGRGGRFDFIALSNVMEMWPPQESAGLLAKASAALEPNGLLVARSILPKISMQSLAGLRRREDLEKQCEAMDRSVICAQFLVWEKEG